MPKYPDCAARMVHLSGSVFEKYAGKMAAQGERLVRLHIGDTYLPPGYPLLMRTEDMEVSKDFNRYCNTFGLPYFREALAAKLGEDNRLNVGPENILVTTGATNALNVSLMTLVDEGEEVLVLSPAWPFLFGMVKLAGGTVVDVPFYMKLMQEPDLDIDAYLREFLSARTVALYLNTPNNPSGKVLTRNQLQQVASVVQEEQLWLISDEAYDGLTFDDRQHISIASLPGMADRTLSAFTFSKSFMFAGLRLGYLAANEEVIRLLNKMMVHELYSPSTLSQQMMLTPLQTRHIWLPDIRQHYQRLRDVAIATLAIDIPEPESGYFAFFPIADYLRGRDYWELVDRCFDAGVSIAPGDSFGAGYGDYIRICFTGEPEERLRLGIERLNATLFGSADR